MARSRNERNASRGIGRSMEWVIQRILLSVESTSEAGIRREYANRYPHDLEKRLYFEPRTSRYFDPSDGREFEQHELNRADAQLQVAVCVPDQHNMTADDLRRVRFAPGPRNFPVKWEDPPPEPEAEPEPEKQGLLSRMVGR